MASDTNRKPVVRSSAYAEPIAGIERGAPAPLFLSLLVAFELLNPSAGAPSSAPRRAHYFRSSKSTDRRLARYMTARLEIAGEISAPD
ncbi:MAG TPA: hypothetical protein VMU06_13490 [Stellaceae bacterium]|nr:hypothetical protein [Stellaceae bacterium]